MAGKIPRVLKVAAALAALACVYLAGQKDAKTEEPPVAQETFGEAVRPGMSEDGLAIAQMQRNPGAYHEAIGEKALDLKARIAQTAYSTASSEAQKPSVIAADATVATGAKDPQAAARASAEPAAGAAAAVQAPVQEKQPDESGQPDSDREEATESFGDTGELGPYERIQKALNTSELFDEKGERAYKPAEFSMPGQAK